MGPIQGIVSSDTSMHFADTKVEANLAKAELGGSFGGAVSASFASGEDLVRFIDWFRLDDQKQNVGNSHLPADSRAEVFDQDSVIRPGWGPVPETLNVENKVNTT